MDSLLTFVSLIIPGIVTILNVITVAKRYNELKKHRNELDKVIIEMNMVNSKLKEVKLRNNGEIEINEKQREEIKKIIQELDLEVSENKMTS